jgi:hypothetical protein
MRLYYKNSGLAKRLSLNGAATPSSTPYQHTKSIDVQVFELLKSLNIDNVKLSVTGPVWVGDIQLTQEQMEAILLNPETTTIQNIINHD